MGTGHTECNSFILSNLMSPILVWLIMLVVTCVEINQIQTTRWLGIISGVGVTQQCYKT